MTSVARLLYLTISCINMIRTICFGRLTLPRGEQRIVSWDNCFSVLISINYSVQVNFKIVSKIPLYCMFIQNFNKKDTFKFEFSRHVSAETSKCVCSTWRQKKNQKMHISLSPRLHEKGWPGWAGWVFLRDPGCPHEICKNLVRDYMEKFQPGVPRSR